MADQADKRTQLGNPVPRVTQDGPLARAAARPTPAPPAAIATGTDATAGQSLLGGAYQEPVDPLIGATLAGRYRVQKKLGEGGMGAVYLAEHTILEKKVALKVLHGELGRKPDLVERFMQEAKAASRIRHENVIDISDFGATEDGYVFFAMELLSGHDLHEAVSRHRLAGTVLPWPRARSIFLQVCSALAAAHAHGIVHRDLKPENIYLVDFLGNKDFVKLLDFGIAKLTDGASDGGDRKLTKTGMLFGTPEYMSPEQARGDKPDHRVDIYAMGCILYQLVVGRVPFEADNFMGILSMHLTEPAPLLTAEQLAAAGAPAGLAAIVARALDKDRNQRWASIGDMANAIRELEGLAPEPVPAPIAASPTGPVAAVAAPASTPAGRQRTQWTGSLSVPEQAEAAAAPRRSKAPLLLAGVLLLGGGGAAAVLLGGGGSEPSGVMEPGAGSGSGSAPVTPADPPVQVVFHFESTPSGARVFELGAQEVEVGQTPLDLVVAGGKSGRRYVLRLPGYGQQLVELVPVADARRDVELVPAGAGGPTTGTPGTPVGGKRPTARVGDGGSGSGDPVKAPDTKTPDTKTPDTKVPDTKVPDLKPVDVPGPDDDDPNPKMKGWEEIERERKAREEREAREREVKGS
ncbi:MAG: serine/threonine protein kinase [Kofleriaceae bacterium]|nr:serine/threonine protein kinase [Kofleriaceae bacterium]